VLRRRGRATRGRVLAGERHHARAERRHDEQSRSVRADGSSLRRSIESARELPRKVELHLLEELDTLRCDPQSFRLRFTFGHPRPTGCLNHALDLSAGASPSQGQRRSCDVLLPSNGRARASCPPNPRAHLNRDRGLGLSVPIQVSSGIGTNAVHFAASFRVVPVPAPFLEERGKNAYGQGHGRACDSEGRCAK
jgi:hypothetical protein